MALGLTTSRKRSRPSVRPPEQQQQQQLGRECRRIVLILMMTQILLSSVRERIVVSNVVVTMVESSLSSGSDVHNISLSMCNPLSDRQTNPIKDEMQMVTRSNRMIGDVNDNVNDKINVNDNDDNGSSSCPFPSLYNQGAVFIYFHLAKAGGTTIRNLFLKPESNAKVLVRAYPNKANYAIQQWLMNSSERRSLFVEFHDRGNPSLPKIANKIHVWKRLAERNHRQLFVFTVLREPISYALSFFTYQNVAQGHMARYKHWDGSKPQAQLTNEDLLDFTLPSPQCLYYSHGEMATTTNFSQYQSNWDAMDSCEQTYHEQLRVNMDWIGTVETLQEQTLPLLTYLSSNDPSLGRSYNKKQNTRGPMMRMFTKLAMANQTIVQSLKEKVVGDQWLYDQVLKDYSWNSNMTACIV